MTEKMAIKIEWSSAALWGSTDPGVDGYDEQASERAFVEILDGYLTDEYPTAEVEIVHGINDRITVNGFTDHDDVPSIENLVNKTWNGNWEVSA